MLITRSVLFVLRILNCLLACTLMCGHSHAASETSAPKPVLTIDPGMHSRWISSMVFDRGSGTIFTASQERVIRRWDALSGQQLQPIRVPSPNLEDTDAASGFCELALSPDGKTLAAASGSDIYFIALPTGRMLRWISGGQYFCIGLTYSPDARFLIAEVPYRPSDPNQRWSHAPGFFRLDMPGMPQVFTQNNAEKADWKSLKFSPDGTHALVTTSDKLILYRYLPEEKKNFPFKLLRQRKREDLGDWVFNGRGDRIAGFKQDGGIFEILDTNDFSVRYREKVKLPAKVVSISNIEFSNDDLIVSTTSAPDLANLKYEFFRLRFGDYPYLYADTEHSQAVIRKYESAANYSKYSDIYLDNKLVLGKTISPTSTAGEEHFYFAATKRIGMAEFNYTAINQLPMTSVFGLIRPTTATTQNENPVRIIGDVARTQSRSRKLRQSAKWKLAP